MHAHILPGVDDGAKDWDTCLEMLHRSAKFGVGAVIATPHFTPWHEGASGQEIRQLCRKAQEKYERKFGISMDIYPGHEIYYDLEVLDRLKKGEVLKFKGKAAYDIYRYMEKLCQQHREKRQELKDIGAMFQMSVDAFQKGFFDGMSRWARGCLLDGHIDFLASDMHNLTDRPPMAEEHMVWIDKRLDPRYKKKLLYGNSRAILPEIK